MKENKILIIGFSGAGKSYLLEQLKKRGETGDDLDQLIIDQTEFVNTREMIAQIGMEKFRIIESNLLKHWLKTSQHKYLALGGGSLTEEHLNIINASSNLMNLYLDKSFSECWEGLTRRGDSSIIDIGRVAAEALFQERRSRFMRLVRLEISKSADDYLNCHSHEA